MDLSNLSTKGKVSLAALAGGAFALLTNPGVLALLPAPWGMILSVFASGVVTGGVAYNMDPKKDAPKQ